MDLVKFTRLDQKGHPKEEYVAPGQIVAVTPDPENEKLTLILFSNNNTVSVTEELNVVVTALKNAKDG